MRGLVSVTKHAASTCARRDGACRPTRASTVLSCSQVQKEGRGAEMPVERGRSQEGDTLFCTSQAQHEAALPASVFVVPFPSSPLILSICPLPAVPWLSCSGPLLPFQQLKAQEMANPALPPPPLCASLFPLPGTVQLPCGRL